MTTTEHQEILVSYINALPIDSNRYLIAKQLMKDLEAQKNMVDIKPKFSSSPLRCKHKTRTFDSIRAAAYCLGINNSNLKRDIISDTNFYGVYLI